MLNLANCYEFQQKYRKAITWYELALLMNPESDDAHYGISLCALKNGDATKALAHIEKGIKLIKDAEEFKEEKIHLIYMKA
jgi:tetratricopeptide (TPR) repeat protein